MQVPSNTAQKSVERKKVSSLKICKGKSKKNLRSTIFKKFSLIAFTDDKMVNWEPTSDEIKNSKFQKKLIFV